MSRIIRSGFQNHRSPVVPRVLKAAVAAVGLLPKDLVKDLVVQFESGKPYTVKADQTLSANVQKLRDAFFWLGTNSWPWMLATKLALRFSRDNLGAELEALLKEYAQSLGSEHDALVPRELLSAANAVQSTRFPQASAGPADAASS